MHIYLPSLMGAGKNIARAFFFSDDKMRNILFVFTVF
jgi:hypothetical protein